MDSDVRNAIYGLWLVAGFVWLLSAFAVRRTQRRQSPGSRRTYILVLVISGLLLFDNHLNVGPLNRRFLPYSLLAQYVGLILTIVGVGFAIWARFFLGSNWSATVAVKQGHTLVRSGPYRIVRHPIYTGFLFAALGTAIAVGQFRGLVATIVAALAWRAKSLVEEQFMTEEFGAEYAAYKREVRALIPFVW